MSLTAINAFGYYPERSEPATLEKINNYQFEKIFCANKWAYIPIVTGQIVGIRRIVYSAIRLNSAHSSADFKKSFYIANIVRGAFETIGLGFLLALIDALVTLGRKLGVPPNNGLASKPARKKPDVPWYQTI